MTPPEGATASKGRAQAIGAVLRDTRFLQALAQAVFILLVLMLARWLVGNLFDNLEARGLDLSFGFLRRTSGFVVGEGIPSARTDPFYYQYIVGLVNTLRVVGLGLLLATTLGILAGVAMLSPNWLLRTLVQSYVEVMRNTPLLVQLFFLYFGIILTLPSLADRISIGPVMLSNRGFWMPRPVPHVGFPAWATISAIALVIGVYVYRRRLRIRVETGRETRPALWGAALIIGVPFLAWFVVPGQPLQLELPELQGLRMIGGLRLTPEFAGILFGLVLYTAAFIADIVRSGILAVTHGQREAALALGLTSTQTLRLIILPQALRVIIPPMTNQYLNLAKNSSLAIGVAFPDLYSVSQTIFNQSGQAVQVIALMMGTYLIMSLIISAVMNTLNARLQIVER
jgi:general L-amino acid transport system permease protein